MAIAEISLNQAAVIPLVALSSGGGWKKVAGTVSPEVMAFAETWVPHYQIALYFHIFEMKFGPERVGHLRSLVSLQIEHVWGASARSEFEQYMDLHDRLTARRNELLADADRQPLIKVAAEEMSHVLTFEYFLASVLLAKYGGEIQRTHRTALELGLCLAKAGHASMIQYDELLMGYRLANTSSHEGVPSASSMGPETSLRSPESMVILTQIRQVVVMNWILIFIPEVLVAVGISTYMHHGLAGTGLVFLAVCALGLIVSLLRTFLTGMVWMLFRKREAERHFLEYLTTNGFPPPVIYLESAPDYFARVVEDPNIEADIRIKAAAEFGTFSALTATGTRLAFFKIERAFDNALTEHGQNLGALPRPS